jgi:hypothetical protein
METNSTILIQSEIIKQMAIQTAKEKNVFLNISMGLNKFSAKIKKTAF